MTFNMTTVAVALFAFQICASVALYCSSGPSPQARSDAIRTMLLILAGSGLALGITYRFSAPFEVERLMALVVGGALLSAVVGMLQVAGLVGAWSGFFNLPGLQLTTEGGIVSSRDGLSRVLGTQSHPIEFSCVLVAALPLSLHLVFEGQSKARRVFGVLAAFGIGVAIPFSISRTAVVASLVALLVYLPVLSKRRWLGVLMIILLGVAAFATVLPSYLGALYKQIVMSGSDDSISGRLTDYPVVEQALRASPWFGGYTPIRGLILDNQWLSTLFFFGLTGLVCLILFLVVSVSAVARASRGLATTAERSEVRAVVAALLALITGFFTFDVFAFGQASLLLFVLIGIGGAQIRRVRDRGVA